MKVLAESVPSAVGQAIVPILHPLGFHVILAGDLHLCSEFSARVFVPIDQLSCIIHYGSAGSLKRLAYSSYDSSLIDSWPVVASRDDDITRTIRFEHRQNIIYTTYSQ